MYGAGARRPLGFLTLWQEAMQLSGGFEGTCRNNDLNDTERHLAFRKLSDLLEMPKGMQSVLR